MSGRDVSPKRPTYFGGGRSITKTQFDGRLGEPSLPESEMSGRDVSPKRPTYFGGGRSIRKRNSTDGLESRPYLKAECQVGTFLQNVRLIWRRSFNKKTQFDGRLGEPSLPESEMSGRDVSPKRPTYLGRRRSIRKRNSTDGLESRPYLSWISEMTFGVA